jgi:hypothetical protein
MNNYKLRNLIQSIFYWNQREATCKKADSKLFDQVWFKLKQPIYNQTYIPMYSIIYNTVRKQNE